MKSGTLRVRTQKCSLCDWTMPSWFDTPEEVKAAFIGHRTSIASCIQASLVHIPESEDAPVTEMEAKIHKLIAPIIPSMALEREYWEVQMGHKKSQ